MSSSSYIAFVVQLSKEERAIFFQEEIVKDEQLRLQLMVDRAKRDEAFIRYATRQAKQCLDDIKSFGFSEASLSAAEEWSELAKGIKGIKYTIGDIRKQRELIQWEKKRLIKLQSAKLQTSKQNGEQSMS